MIFGHYTGFVDVPDACIQMLNEEIRFAQGRKEGENSLLIASKGVLGALTAIVPTMDIIVQRGSEDPELDAQAQHHKTIGGNTQPNQE